MAGITSELLTTMLKSSLNNLKLFAELVNAELTEDGQENDCREKHKVEVSKILQKFGEAEASFEKGVKCLRKVDAEVKKKVVLENDTESVQHDILVDRIKSIIRLVEGKERVANVPEEPFEQRDENKLSEHVRGIKDILNDIHPLAYEENEAYDSDEENRMVLQLEEMQKKQMVKSMKKVVDEKEEGRTEENMDFDNSDDENLNIAADSFERAPKKRHHDKYVEGNRLDEMFNKYKRKMIQGLSANATEIYDHKIESEKEVDFKALPFISKYKDKILELFSKEAVVVLSGRENYTDPISKTAIKNPVRNKICEHIYERDTIYSFFHKKKTMACPCMGCSCRAFTINDLEEDEETAAKITQNLARARLSEAEVDEEAETDPEDDDEVGPEDDTQSQEIL